MLIRMQAWHPLLTGELAELACQWLCRFAEAWENPEPESRGVGPGGLAGLALFYGYLARMTGQESFSDVADRHLDEAIERSDVSLRAGFFTGFTGIAWTCQHLSGLIHGEIPPGLVSEVDEVLLEAVGSPDGAWHHDLLLGLAGVGCYAVDHPDRTFAMVLIERIVERLAETAIPFAGGIAWRTDPSFLDAKAAARQSGGVIELGAAHGLAGVVGMLGRACGAGLAPLAARQLLDEAVRALLAARRPQGEGSRYSQTTVSRSLSCPSSWCQGDPGIAAALLGAARHAGEAAWEEEALATVLQDCARTDESRGVMDLSLCHGSAGLGHLYNRLYQATGREELGREARSWFERTLKELLPVATEGVSRASFLLEGGPGIGLALIAALSEMPPDWDRPMLLGIPQG